MSDSIVLNGSSLKWACFSSFARWQNIDRKWYLTVNRQGKLGLRKQHIQWMTQDPRMLFVTPSFWRAVAWNGLVFFIIARWQTLHRKLQFTVYRQGKLGVRTQHNLWMDAKSSYAVSHAMVWKGSSVKGACFLLLLLVTNHNTEKCSLQTREVGC